MIAKSLEISVAVSISFENFDFVVTTFWWKLAPNCWKDRKAYSKESNVSISSSFDCEMPSVEIEGCDFIGLIEVPSYGIKLPIYSEFEYYIPKVYSRNNNGSLVVEGRYSENQFSFADYIYRPILQYISL